MKILFSPRISRNRVNYAFDKDIIHVEMNYRGAIYTDIFDFSGFPDGELQLFDEADNYLVKTKLPISPLVSAKRIDGNLFVELLNWIDADEENVDVLFPNWIEVE